VASGTNHIGDQAVGQPAGKQARGLGRGLGALIPPAASFSGEERESKASGVMPVAVADIMPNPRQPRATIAADTLAELAASIREHGLIQPLIITRAQPTAPVPYQLIAGERRWRAAQLAGLQTVPALLKEATPQQLLELALVENIQRADLNALEEAAAYQSLMSEFGLTQAEVAQRVGRSRVAVANVVRLLRLPDRIKELLAKGALSEGHGRALLGLEDDELMVRAAGLIVVRDLNVRQTEELVRRMLAAAEAGDDEPQPEAQDEAAARLTQQLEADFRGVLGTKVALLRGRRGGRLVIHFYSDEELQSLYEHIVGR
jgi:ParB family chromosome partitioning protein